MEGVGLRLTYDIHIDHVLLLATPFSPEQAAPTPLVATPGRCGRFFGGNLPRLWLFSRVGLRE